MPRTLIEVCYATELTTNMVFNGIAMERGVLETVIKDIQDLLPTLGEPVENHWIGLMMEEIEGTFDLQPLPDNLSHSWGCFGITSAVISRHFCMTDIDKQGVAFALTKALEVLQS